MPTFLGLFLTAAGLFLFLWYRTVVGLPESTRPMVTGRLAFKWGVPSLSMFLFFFGILILAWGSVWHALAGLAVGFWGDRAEVESAGELRVFEPQMDAGRRDALYAGWKRAVERSRDWEPSAN